MTQTELDRAQAAMDGDDDAARMRYFERLAESELFMLLESDPADGPVRPQVFEVEDNQLALVFDREERLSDFQGGAAPYAALSGRVIAMSLKDKGVGLLINPSEPSAVMLPADAIGWLAGLVAEAPSEIEQKLAELTVPGDVPEVLLSALDRKLATASARAVYAYLCGVTYENGAKGLLLGFVDPTPGAEGALAQVVSEALTFSGIEAGAVDVIFVKRSDSLAARMAKVGLRFDLPQVEATPTPVAPGSDPDKPPRLR